MTASTVTFETKVWEGDYRTVLQPKRLGTAIELNDHDFAERVVVINNVARPRDVVRRCRALVRSGVIDDYHLVEDHAAEALEMAGLEASDLGVGYRYSIGELVGVLRCHTEHLLHFSGDSMLAERVDWIPASLQLLAERLDVKVVNLTWNERFDEVTAEASGRVGPFWLSQGFSDQMYLVRTADLRARVYLESHSDSERYPAYGGELFEKRLDSWLRSNDFLRATSTAGSYRHVNIPPHRRPLRRAFDRLRRS